MGSSRELRPVRRAHDEGVDVEVTHGLADRLAVDRSPAVVEPCREQTLGAVIGDVDAREPLDRVRPEEARHEGPQRKAVLDRERRAVHRPRQEHVVLPRVLERKILDVMIAGDAGEHAVVGRLQPHGRRFGLHACPGQDLGEGHAAPGDVADAPGRHVGLHRVAEALEHGDDVARGQARDLVVVEPEGLLDEAVDHEAPVPHVDVGDAHVGDHVHVLGRRDGRRELRERHQPANGLSRVHRD